MKSFSLLDVRWRTFANWKMSRFIKIFLFFVDAKWNSPLAYGLPVMIQ